MKLKQTILLMLWSMLMLPLMAAGTDEAIFSFRTSRFQTMGADNQISFSVMPRQAVRSTTIDVDFGFGRKTFTIDYDHYVSEDDSTETLIGGTTISGQVGPEGLVRVYGEATDIDYLDIHGSEVYDIDITKLTRLMILSLAHNDIKHLDVSMMRELQYLNLTDNPFDEGLTIGEDHPSLYYLNLNRLGNNALTSGTVNLSCFPLLQVFTAWDTKCLKSLDVSKNQNLLQISIDNSGVQSLDVTHNPYLRILNVSDCGFSTLDISQNKSLVELYIDNEGQTDADHKLSTLDVSQNTHLQRIFCNGNMLQTLDVSHQRNLVSLYASSNYLTKLQGLEKIDSLAYLDLSVNCFDFASFPKVDPMTYFYYVLQRDMEVENEYQTGSTLDLGNRVLRKGTETQCALALIPSSGIEDPILLEEGKDYQYSNGKIKFLKSQSERVVAYFVNSEFPDVTLKTTEFWVRSEKEFGKPVTQITFIPKSKEDGSDCNVSFTIGVERNPSKPEEQILVNFGREGTTAYTLTDNNTVTVEGVATGAVTVSGRIELPISTLVINNTELESIDLSQAHYLKTLDLSGDSLRAIDLSWNNLLTNLNLNNNKLDSLVLTGANDAHHKNILSRVTAHGNNLVYFEDAVGITIEYLDLSDNKFSEIEFNDYNGLKHLDLSNNRLSSLNLEDCTELVELHIEGNAFRLSTLPQLEIPNYNYAPQCPLTIASRSMSVTLSSEAFVGGIATSFVWKNANDGTVLKEGTDYTVTETKFIFLEPTVDKDVYCELSNATFPNFDESNPFRTTTVHVMGKPNYTVATFKTPVGGEIGTLSLASKKDDTFIYIDWGNGDMIEYQLQTMYHLFEAETVKGADVNVYSYEAADGNIQVFSIDGISMSKIDVSKMPDLYCLSLCGANLKTIDLSHNTGLVELNLEGNKLTSIDLSSNSNLYSLVLANNQLSDIDLSHQKGLGWLVLSNNNLSRFDGSNLGQLYALSLTRNKLTELDLSPLVGLRQLAVAENQLSTIDLSKHPVMEIVDLSSNKFTLATLPIPTSNYMIYSYGNQEPVSIECIDGKIDMHDMAEISGVASNFYWFEGELEFYYDEDDNLQMTNYEFVQGTDFIVENGVTSFVQSQPAVTGYVQNDLFPNIILLTRTIPVTGISSIEKVHTDAYSTGRFNLFGQRVEKETGFTISNGKKILR